MAGKNSAARWVFGNLRLLLRNADRYYLNRFFGNVGLLAKSKPGIAQCAYQSRRPHQRPPAGDKSADVSGRGGAKGVYVAGEQDLSEEEGESEWVDQDFPAPDVLSV